MGFLFFFFHFLFSIMLILCCWTPKSCYCLGELIHNSEILKSDNGIKFLVISCLKYNNALLIWELLYVFIPSMIACWCDGVRKKKKKRFLLIILKFGLGGWLQDLNRCFCIICICVQIRTSGNMIFFSFLFLRLSNAWDLAVSFHLNPIYLIFFYIHCGDIDNQNRRKIG